MRAKGEPRATDKTSMENASVAFSTSEIPGLTLSTSLGGGTEVQGGDVTYPEEGQLCSL